MRSPAALLIAACVAAAGCGEERSAGKAWAGTLDRIPQWIEPSMHIETGQALVTAHGLTAAAGSGTHCVHGPKGGYCVDSVGLPPDSPVLPVEPGAVVGIRLEAPARVVTGWIARLDRATDGKRLSRPVAATPGGRDRRSWTLGLPDRAVPPGAALQFRVGYRDWRGEPVVFDQRIGAR